MHFLHYSFTRMQNLFFLSWQCPTLFKSPQNFFLEPQMLVRTTTEQLWFVSYRGWQCDEKENHIIHKDFHMVHDVHHYILFCKQHLKKKKNSNNKCKDTYISQRTMKINIYILIFKIQCYILSSNQLLPISL